MNEYEKKRKWSSAVINYLCERIEVTLYSVFALTIIKIHLIFIT